jgi:hypothetical protein
MSLRKEVVDKHGPQVQRCLDIASRSMTHSNEMRRIFIELPLMLAMG